ncbi:hypothetical protein HHK36_001604 [Tetracentron sinense]|uniref:Magnesium transporter CorA-like family protein n=1 Tax=Tetracentron sinense TaxID=13715 RepID=A0A835DV67_TETSI|nr:hypothetical protein HHK36_001604 [Tetracentron sinense]
MKQQDNEQSHIIEDVGLCSDPWKDGLICAFELVQGHRKRIWSKSGSKIPSAQQIDGEDLNKEVPKYVLSGASNQQMNGNNLSESAFLIEVGANDIAPLDDHRDGQNSHSARLHMMETSAASRWIPIGWARISELITTGQFDSGQVSQFADDKYDLTVGPTWWCHVSAENQFIQSWLSNPQWLDPTISSALRNESQLISDRMKHLRYEVPVRTAGGLLFELLGQSVGDPFVDEDDIPIVLRSWQAQNFLITALHVKGSASIINVLGIVEVQEILSAGGTNAPRTIHEVIAHLACRLSRWDDRLFRKFIFGAADEVELKFMDRRNHEDMKLFSLILNKEIRRLSRQVIRVKWSLHAREEIVFELLQYLRGNTAKSLLEGIRKNTREMIEEQEAVRGRLFTIQDVMQSTVRAGLQDRSLRVTHNLAVFGGCGLILSILTGLFGINVDGIPGSEQTPYAFGLFAAMLFLLGSGLIGVGLIYLRFKNPISEEQIRVKKLKLQELVKMFQHEAETHAQIQKAVSRCNLTPTAGDLLVDEQMTLFSADYRHRASTV